MKILLGPQGEPIEIREKTTSAVAAGTDRAEFAVTQKPFVGPQGELIYPSFDVLCPTCGQPFPEETCSQPGEEPDGFDDPDNAPVDDRDDIKELSA